MAGPPRVTLMVCTAGHVDHGKTSLVKLLTGCDTDRLKEEKERGLTIELGFAPCTLGGDLRVGIVDVPGHEHFIRNMVSGVPGIDAAIFVVAADDGVMPQTQEHLEILGLLGVRHGVVALSKIDLVSPETVDRRVREVKDLLRDTCLAASPVCPLSTTTFQGYDSFYTRLAELLGGLHRERRVGVFRMPVERVFTARGHGTVASGVPLAGCVRVGDVLEAVPSLERGRVKGIECFGESASEGGTGQCLALNIPDLRGDVPLKGQVLAPPGYQKAVNNLGVDLTTVRRMDGAVRNAEEIKLHAGTLEAFGKVYLLDTQTAPPRSRARALVFLEQPVPVSVGDAFLLRRASPAATIGGGVVLWCALAVGRLGRTVVRAALDGGAGPGDATETEGLQRRAEAFVRSAGPDGATAKGVARELLLETPRALEALGRAVAGGSVREVSPGRYAHAKALDEARRAVAEHIAGGLARGRLVFGRSEVGATCKLGVHALSAVLADLEAAGVLEARGAHLVPAEGRSDWPRDARDLVARARALYRDGGWQTPGRLELPARLGAVAAAASECVDYLVRKGDIVELGPNVIVAREKFIEAQSLVVEIVKKEGSVDSGLFKLWLGSTRKYALAVLDALDARGVTLRRDNLRTLAPGWEGRLLA